MKRKLEMDDVRIGMYITILKGKIDERMVPGINGPKFRTREKDHYNGRVLEVLNVLMPYIAVNVHDRRGVRPDTIDLRHVEIMGLTEEYIHALLPGFEMKREPFWDEIAENSLKDVDAEIKNMFDALNE
jgi:hypothetical protein